MTPRIRLVCGDAATFEVPSGPIVAFLYHPFGERVAGEAMLRIAISLRRDPRPAAILYVHSTTLPRYSDRIFSCEGLFVPDPEGPTWTIWRSAIERRHATA